MEKHQTIDEYIATYMGDKIVRKAKSPLQGIFILVAGIGLLLMLHTLKLSDAMTTSCLTFGIIFTGLGIIITAMCITKSIWHYVYLPTHSRMRRHKCYLNSGDYQHCIECIGDNNITALATLLPIVSSNCALDLLYSQDGVIVLLQFVRDNSGHFEPETPVILITGTEVNAVQHLCK